jgi:hypothetical protein
LWFDLHLHGYELRFESSSVGYKTVALTTTPSKAGSISPSPFKNGLPFPHLTRNKTQTEVIEGTGPGAGAVGARLDQFSRLHLVLDDSSTHGLVRPLLYHSLIPIMLTSPAVSSI